MRPRSRTGLADAGMDARPGLSIGEAGKPVEVPALRLAACPAGVQRTIGIES
jgi:hypothetical protein